MKLGNGHFSKERCCEGTLPFYEGAHCCKEGSGDLASASSCGGPGRPGLGWLCPFTMAGKSPAHSQLHLPDRSMNQSIKWEGFFFSLKYSMILRVKM